MLEGLKREAQEAKKGLWADPLPVPPWEWRKRKECEGAQAYSLALARLESACVALSTTRMVGLLNKSGRAALTGPLRTKQGFFCLQGAKNL